MPWKASTGMIPLGPPRKPASAEPITTLTA
jgi:hypothetical protein